MKMLGFGPPAFSRKPLSRGRAGIVAAAMFVAVLALVPSVVLAQQPPEGADVYETNCVSCHGASGGGGVGPALAGNGTLAEAETVVRQILRGGAGMPAFAGPLTDAQIAAVATYIRTSWGNDFGAVEPSLVGELREGGGAPAGDGPPAEDSAEQDAPPEEDEQEQPDGQQQQTEEQQPEEAEQQEDGEQPDGEEQRDASEAAAPVVDRTATLRIRVEPQSASVEVVGPTGFEQASREGGEMTFEGVPAGPYRITVTHDGETFVQLVDLTRGGRAEVVFELGGGGG